MTEPPRAAAKNSARMLRETVYGSRKRLAWVLRHVTRDDAILEVGCGTGYMLCRPLAAIGYRVEGIDLDAKSIEHGQDLLRGEGLDPGILSCCPLSTWPGKPGVVIASEVLEHLADAELDFVIARVKKGTPLTRDRKSVV